MLFRVSRSFLTSQKLNFSQRLCRAVSTNHGFYEDDIVMQFPREREGNNYAVNWSMATDGVPPYGNAFYDHKFEKLVEFAKGTEWVEKEGQLREVDVNATYEEFDGLRTKVRNHLSESENVFVQDGFLGSFADESIRVRVITDSPLIALFAKNSFIKCPKNVLNSEAKSPVVLYIASSGNFQSTSPETLYCLQEDEGNVVHIVMTGDVSSSAIRNVIVKAKKDLLSIKPENASVLLECDVMRSEGKTALVFNASDVARRNGVESGVLYGGHHNLWNPLGLTSCWGGVTVVDKDASLKSKNMLVSNGFSTLKYPSNNIVEHPSAAIFVLSESKDMKEMDLKSALDAFKAMEKDETFVANFEKLMKEHQTKAYSVGSNADISKAFSNA